MIIQDIFGGESKNVEYKVELPKNSEKYIKTVIAFSNSSGGNIIIGVEDKSKKIVGVDEKEVFRIMDSIANAISDCCQPQIIPNITFQTIDNKCIVIIEVYPGANRPYYLKSVGKDKGSYIRVAGTTRLADYVRLKELEMEGVNLSWDELPCIGYTLNEEAILKLCNDIYKYRMQSIRADEKNEIVQEVGIEQLLNWKILKRTEGSLVATNAFVLFTSDYFSFSKIQCALFKGNERDIFIDKKEYSGSLYEQIESAYQFVQRHINLGAEIEGIIRKDVYELPLGAIREMIVNAVCHRNYMDNSCVQVAVYDNRVEVTSPGMLYGGLTLEEALNGRSKIRNKIIAEIFGRMEIVEKWGTGIRRIINRADEYGLPEPQFLEIGDTFRVNLYRTANKKPIESNKKPIESNKKPIESNKKPIESNKKPIESNKKPIESNKKPIESNKKPIESNKKPIESNKKPIENNKKSIENNKKSIKSNRENRIFDFIKKNGSITNKEARELLELAESTTKRILKQMVDEGKLNIIGDKRTRRYYKS